LKSSQSFLPFLLLAALLSAPAYCDVVSEIELPGLTGSYTGADIRIAEFVLGNTPGEIYGMQLRLTGVLHPGTQDCSCLPSYPYQSMGMHYLSYIQDQMTAPDSRWEGTYGLGTDFSDWSNVDFRFVITFAPVNGATWDSMLDGSGTIALNTAGLVLDWRYCYGMEEPSCEITGAVLIIDADISVPTAYSTWGAVKSIMR
jgi:hypothetical protein